MYKYVVNQKTIILWKLHEVIYLYKKVIQFMSHKVAKKLFFKCHGIKCPEHFSIFFSYQWVVLVLLHIYSKNYQDKIILSTKNHVMNTLNIQFL